MMLRFSLSPSRVPVELLSSSFEANSSLQQKSLEQTSIIRVTGSIHPFQAFVLALLLNTSCVNVSILGCLRSMVRICNKLYNKKLKGNPVDASLARLAPLPICLKLAWKDCDSTASSQRTSDSHQDSALCKLCPQGKPQTPTCRPKHNLLPERGSVPVSASWPPTLTTHAQMSDHKKPRNSSPKFSKRSKQSLVMFSQSMSTGSGEHLSHTPHKSLKPPRSAVHDFLRC